VPALRADLTATLGPTEVYNLGVEGTGMQHFADLLVSFARDQPFTHVVIVAISNDFQRPRWRPEMAPDGLHFCPPDEMPQCLNGAPTATIIGYHDSDAEILEHTWRVERQAAARTPDSSFVDKARKLAQHSQLLRRVSRLVKARSGTRRKLIEDSMGALASVREHFPAVPITFIQLPEKEEVQMNRYLFDPEGRLRNMGVKYYPALRLCPWSPAMFLPRDNHPNATGYEKVEQCVLKLLLAERSSRHGGRIR